MKVKIRAVALVTALLLLLSACSSGQKEKASFDIESVPEFDGEPYVEIDENVPAFEDEDKTTEPFETYSPLDGLGRCGTAYANICKELMPTEERGEIGQIKPSGWQTVKYDFVDGKYLYNRCHLIGFQLAGENANEKNLITGTRYLNVEGMLPFENMVADYVKETGNHVLYRVTPIFEGRNLVASGVQMEAFSVEDDGDGICFNVYCYNNQPGATIDYLTGESAISDSMPEEEPDVKPKVDEDNAVDSKDNSTDNNADDSANETADEKEDDTAPDTALYVLNTNTMKFHYPDCQSVGRISEKNKEEFTGSRDELIARGYGPCGKCKP